MRVSIPSFFAINLRGRMVACTCFLFGVTLCAQQPKSPPPAPIANFTDVAEKSGLTMQNVFGGVDTKKYIIETTGTGVAIFDYDNDGWPDIFLVNGTRLEGFPAGQGSEQPAVSQQSRRNVHRRHRQGWPHRDWMGTGRLRRRLRQRRMGRSLHHVLRQEPALPQSEWGLHGGRARRAALRDRARRGAPVARSWITTATAISIWSWRTMWTSIWRRRPSPGERPTCIWKGVPVMCGPRGLAGSEEHSLPQSRRWNV